MYFLVIFFLMIVGAIQEWNLTAWVYAWLAERTSGSFALLEVLLSFFLAAALGMKLFSRVGLKLLRKAQQQLAQGQVPDRTLAEGLILVASAMLLIAPGYLSDAIGILALILRKPLAFLLLKIFKNNLKMNASFVAWPPQTRRPAQATQDRIGHDPLVIDVEAFDEKK